MNLQKHKLAWEDFYDWYQFKSKIVHKGIFGDLPFEMQLGVYLKYFKELKSIELDIPFFNQWLLHADWKKMIEQAFKIRNEQLK